MERPGGTPGRLGCQKVDGAAGGDGEMTARNGAGLSRFWQKKCLR